MKEVIGIESVNYVKDGKNYFGTRLFVSSPLTSTGSIGVSVEDVYISSKSASEFHLGPILAVLYDKGYSGKFFCTGVLYPDKEK